MTRRCVYWFFPHFRVFIGRLPAIFFYSFFCDSVKPQGRYQPQVARWFAVKRGFSSCRGFCVVSALPKDHEVV